MNAMRKVWRNRWFVLGIGFLAINTWGVLRYTGNAGPSDATVVQRVTPDLQAAALGPRHNLTWQFSRPMVEDAAVGQSTPEGPVTMAPPQPGLFVWDHPKLLRFAPAADWQPCTRYRVRLLDGVQSLDGFPVLGDRSWEFATAPLAVVQIAQTATEDLDAVVRIDFTAPVAASDLRDHLTATDRKGQSMNIRLDGQAVAATHFARVHMAEDQTRIRIRAGLPPHRGDLPMQDEIGRDLSITGRLQLQVVRPITPPFEPPYLEIQFNQGVDPRVARSFLQVTPGQDLRIEPSPDRSNSLRIHSPSFRPGSVARVVIEGGLPGGHGRPLESRLERSVQFEDRRPRVAFRASGRYLSPERLLVLPVAVSALASFQVEIDRVFDNNLVAFAHDHTEGDHRPWSTPAHWVSRRVASFAVPVRAADGLAEVPLDLRPHLPTPPDGAYQVTVSLPDRGDYDRYVVFVSDLGITARAWEGGLMVWVNGLTDALPAAGCDIAVFSHTNQELARGRTDADGLVRIDLPADLDRGRPYLLTAAAGGRQGFLMMEDTQVQPRGETGGRPHARHPYEAFVHTDRGIARPGETARVRAILRDPDLGVPAPFPVRLRIRRPDGRVFQNLHATLSTLGTAAWDFPVPAEAPTGSYSLEITPPGSDIVYGFGRIAIEEYVPPQIRVEAKTAEGRVAASDAVVVDVVAEHLFGAPAAGLPASARAEIRPVAFSPAGWESYRFGDPRREMSPRFVDVGRGTLDADGRGRFRVMIPSDLRPAAALRVLVGATVTEPNGRASTAFAGQDVDVAPYYLGVRTWTGNLTIGSSQRIDLAAVLPDGTAHDPGRPLPAVIEKITWTSLLRRNESRGQYRWHSEEITTPVAETSLRFVDGRSTWEFTPSESGSFRLVVQDDPSGVSLSLPFWVSGPGAAWSSYGRAEPDRVQLRLDRERYRAGDTAMLHVEAPFEGSLLLTLETDRVREARRIGMAKAGTTIPIPVTADMAPNVFCTVTVIRPTGFGPEGVQVRSSGVVRLDVEQPRRVLRVTNFEPPRPLAPGDALVLPVLVRDDAGEPVAHAEVTVAAVDEGICLLTAFTTPDPAAFFLAPRHLGTRWHDLYRHLMPVWDGALVDGASLTAGDGGGSLGRRLNPIQARRFRPTVLWSGVRTTDGDGRAVVDFTLPEFSGTLRIMTVAVSRDGFGRSHPDDAVTVKRPLTARWSLPRFLAPGDRCDVAVQLYADEEFQGEARARIEVGGPLAVRGAADLAQTLDPGQRVDHAFALTAGDTPGVATVTLHVEAGRMSWSETEEIAVRPAAALTQTTGSLSVAAGEERTFVAGRAWLKGTLGGGIWVSGLPSLELAPGLSHLLRYPYGCLEQTVSSAFPLLYLADLAAAVEPEALGGAEVTPFVEAGIRRVLGMQGHHGGFGWWSGSDSPWPWGSAYASHFLAEAKRAGYDVPEDRLAALDAHLKSLLSRPLRERTDVTSGIWIEDMGARAYAAWVLALRGQPDAGWMARLRELHPHLSRSAAVHTVAALAVAGDRRAAHELLGQIGLPASSGARGTGFSDSLASPARDDALLLSAWVDLDPEHERVPILIERLRKARAQGRWYTTQENAMALMALGKYARRIRDRDPQFAATLTGPGTDPRAVGDEAPLHVRLDADTPEGGWTLRNRGPARAYVYWRAEGVPADGETSEVDHGLSVRRELLDLQGNPIGGRPLHQGELVIVRIHIDALGHARDHVAIDDLLPAGLEVENPRLATSALAPWLQARGIALPRHLEVRDDRVLFFSQQVAGRASFAYAARAVTPGTYAWPAVEAHCMYDPDVRSAHGRTTLTVVKGP